MAAYGAPYVGGAPPPPPPPYGASAVPIPAPQQAPVYAPPPPPQPQLYPSAQQLAPQAYGQYSGFSQQQAPPPPPPQPQASVQAAVPPPPPQPPGFSQQQQGYPQPGTAPMGVPAPVVPSQHKDAARRAEEERARREKAKRAAAAAGGSSGSKPHHSSSSHHHHHGHKPSSSSHGKPGSSSHKPGAAPGGKPGSSSSTAGLGAAENRLRRDTPFLAHIKFRNDLPEIPSDPKMLVSRARPDALAGFSLTSLEKQPCRDLMVPPAIHISPLDAERFQVPEGVPPPELDPADAALLKDDAMDAMGGAGGLLVPGVKQGRAGRNFGARSKQMGLDMVGWLMKTQYISNDVVTLHKQGISEKQAVLMAQQQQAKEADDGPADREAQVASIIESFEAAKRMPKHIRNPALKPVEILPLLPDFANWPNKYVVTQFEGGDDPLDELAKAAAAHAHAEAGGSGAPPPLSNASAKQLVGHTMLKGFTVTERGTDQPIRIMALLTPRNVAPAVAGMRTQERLRAEAQVALAEGKGSIAGPSSIAVHDVTDLEGEYDWVKEYKYDVDKDRAHYFVRLTKEAALYCEMGMTIKLKRREEKGGGRGRRRGEGGDEEADDAGEFQRPSKIVVSYRDAADKELAERAEKLNARNMPLPPELAAAVGDQQD